MFKDGDFVKYRNGKTKWQVIATARTWDRATHTLASTVSGRKRYAVHGRELTLWAETVPVSVKTSRGVAKRPGTWKTYRAFSGTTRRTYIGKTWVFKKALHARGESANAREAILYALQAKTETRDALVRKHGAYLVQRAEAFMDVPVAECHLLPDGSLMMERVTPIHSLQASDGAPEMSTEERKSRGLEWGGKNRPAWLAYIDSEQAGVNRKGQLVAYDL